LVVEIEAEAVSGEIVEVPEADLVEAVEVLETEDVPVEIEVHPVAALEIADLPAEVLVDHQAVARDPGLAEIEVYPDPHLTGDAQATAVAEVINPAFILRIK
jgi:hypothetical protein